MSKYIKGTFALITGASKGIGRTLAVELSKILKVDATIILLARSEKGLLETKAEILKVNHEINVLTFPVDLSKPDSKQYTDIMCAAVNSLPEQSLENAVIFHNAGSIGLLDTTTNLTDLSYWRRYYDLNMFSVALLNSVFLDTMRSKSKNITVVNITSLCGSKPFNNMAMYGSGKAARNLFFKVLAEEDTSINVLNYSPGPVDTDMVEEVISNIKDVCVKSMFTGLKEHKTILKAEQTIAKLLEVLENNKYKSGDIVDYFDRLV